MMEIENYNIRKTDIKHGFRGAFAVIIKNPEVWPWGGMKSNSIGITSAGEGKDKGQFVQITFNYSAYKRKNGLHVSASGGPGTIGTPIECLKFTGYEVEINFWQFKNNYVTAGNGEYYNEFVPLFEWVKSEEEALCKPEQITYKDFKKLKESNIVKIENDFYNDWVRNDKGLAEYMPEYKEVFALPKIVDRTSETIVLNVVYKKSYWYWKGSKRTKYKNLEYFKQPMVIYDPKFKPINSELVKFSTENYFARPFYK